MASTSRPHDITAAKRVTRLDSVELTEGHRVLAVMSPAYFHSYYARMEWINALGDPDHDDRLLPVRVVHVQPPPLLANRIYIDLVDLQEGLAAERLLAGVRPGRVPSGRSPFPGADGSEAGAVATFPGRQPVIFNVPPRNLNFTGRRDLLQKLRQNLCETEGNDAVRATAVYGLGGVGKTQLAIEYAHRFASDYDLVWWIPAEKPKAIPGHLATLGRRLELPDLPRLEDQLAEVFDELSQGPARPGRPGHSPPLV